MLPHDYADEDCSLARSLEEIGQRWTLLIVRDAFYGVRRFSDFAEHLRLPRTVLSRRLRGLVTAGLMARVDGPGGHLEYVLTPKGLALWPAVRALIGWGDRFCSPNGVRRRYHHILDNGIIDASGTCPACGTTVSVGDIVMKVGPGLDGSAPNDDPISRELRMPHRFLEPVGAAPGGFQL